MIRPGAVVAYWDDAGQLQCGVVAEKAKGERFRIVTADGKEIRIPGNRVAEVLHTGSEAPGPGPEGRRRAAARAQRAAEALAAEASAVEAEALWSLVQEEDPGRTWLVDDLAEVALGRNDARTRAAVAWALSRDAVRFVRRPEGWQARPEQEVRAIETQKARQRRREAARERAREQLLAALDGGGPLGEALEFEREWLADLERVALEGAAAPSAVVRRVAALLRDAGLAYDDLAEGAFRALRKLGRFASDDENLEILRYRLRTDFPEPVLEEARRAAEYGPRGGPRRDLTALEAVTIDGPWTVELDDALSLEPLGPGRARLGVHIADPAAFVEIGGALDEEALLRAVTYYFPDRRLPMLPPVLSEGAASLVAGERRPVVSFLVELDAEARIAAWEIARAWIRVVERLEYGQADARLAQGGERAELLRALDRIARAREAARVREGAVILRVPEVDVRVAPSGEIELYRVDPDSPSRRIVAEAMILAGMVAAAFCSEHGLPVIHRRQAPPAGEVAPRGEVRDPVEVRAVRRLLRRAEVGLTPAPHFALGAPAYAQVTSPLRRYQDLASHRQIAAALEGEPPPYDAAALQRIAASTERAEAEGRRAEAAATRYWLLRYMERLVGHTVDGIVVDVRAKPRVLLCETWLEETVPGLAAVEPGARVRLRVERVQPRAGRLVLRPAE